MENLETVLAPEGTRKKLKRELRAEAMMFSFMLADETSSLRLCKYCMKAFFAKSDDEDFCSPACEANYERENGR